MKCVLKFAVDYEVRPAKLIISNKYVAVCAGEYKVRHLRG